MISINENAEIVGSVSPEEVAELRSHYRKPLRYPHSTHPRKNYRWRSPQRPDAATLAPTKSEAIAFFKRLIGVEKLPDGFVVERF